jgi:hypothetical protein
MDYSARAYRYSQEVHEKAPISSSEIAKAPRPEPAKQARGTTNGNKKKR